MGKHSEWRKLAKKQRRKRLRQEIASIRHDTAEQARKIRDNSPSYKQWQEEQRKIDEFQTKEELRLACEAERNYQEREREAQKQWVELQKKLSLAREERAKQVAKIKEEWQKEQDKLKKLKDDKERKELEQRRKHELLQEKIENFIHSNGDMPCELNEMLESNPGKTICPFFKKTAACRFNDTCSRNHVRPTISRVVLIRNFYTHYSLEQTMENEHGSDSILEFETHEMYSNFKEFFNDILPELKNYGHLRQLKVCCNQEAHLRGNVYVEYSTFKEAVKSYRALQGRWYGGKQINAEFCNIESWKSAICGLFFQQRCPKGSVCNFLHVFRNPSNMFFYADKDQHRTPPTNDFESNDRSDRNWRWSESPERETSRHNLNKSCDRNGSCVNLDFRKRHHRSKTRDSSRSSYKSRRSRSSERNKRSSSRHKSKRHHSERS